MTIGTLCTKAVLFLYCDNCGEKNTLTIESGKVEDENQLPLFPGSTKV
jgi:hypothetical protein